MPIVRLVEGEGVEVLAVGVHAVQRVDGDGLPRVVAAGVAASWAVMVHCPGKSFRAGNRLVSTPPLEVSRMDAGAATGNQRGGHCNHVGIDRREFDFEGGFRGAATGVGMGNHRALVGHLRHCSRTSVLHPPHGEEMRTSLK